jgi:tetratricopeptide (TPR) repeat protein
MLNGAYRRAEHSDSPKAVSKRRLRVTVAFVPRPHLALFAFVAVALCTAAAAAEPARGAPKKRYVSSQAYYHAMRAELALSKNELVEASEELQLALVYDSDSKYLTVQLARVSLKLGWIAKAEKLADRALALDGTDPRAWILRAHVQLSKSQVAAAEKSLKKALENDPASVDASIELARLVARRGSPKEAIAILYKSAERAPRSTEPFTEIAQIEVGRRRLTAAARALEYALERDARRVEVAIALSAIYERQARYDDAVQVWRKIVELVPGDLDAMFYGARAELWVERDDLAEKLVSAIQTMQKSPETDLKLGLMYLEEGRPAHASVLLAESVRATPSDQRARFAYGISMLQLGKDEPALAELETIGPDHELYADARIRIGNVLLGLGRADRAKLALRAALEHQPRSPSLISFFAGLLEKTGQVEEAMFTVREAKKALPHDLELAEIEASLAMRSGDRDRGMRIMRAAVEQSAAPSEDALYRLGVVYERSGESELAVDTMYKLLREHPDSARAMNFLGYLYAGRATRLDEAEKLLRRALALEPRSGAILDSLGFVCFRRGKLDLAERYLLRATRLQPNDAEVLEHLGDVFLARGKSDAARGSYLRARTALDRAILAKEPSAPPNLARVRKKLAELPGPARAEP